MDEQLFYRLVGRRVRDARQRHVPPISQAQLAAKLSMSRASIVNLEAGRQHPPLHVLWQIAEALGTEGGLLIPSQAEFASQRETIDLDEQTKATIEAAADGDPGTRRQLIEFVSRVQARKTGQK